MIEIRPAQADDLPFLAEMCYQAATCGLPGRPPMEVVLAEPHVSRYLHGWHPTRHNGRVAVADGQPVGAAWYADIHLDGAGRPPVATVCIAVRAEFRHRHIGRRLLDSLLDGARAAELPALDLTYSLRNPEARPLYVAAGFVELPQLHGMGRMRRRLSVPARGGDSQITPTVGRSQTGSGSTAGCLSTTASASALGRSEGTAAISTVLPRHLSAAERTGNKSL